MLSQKLILTENELLHAIHTGEARQSPLGNSFVMTCRQEIGIDPVLCYAHSYMEMEGGWNTEGRFVQILCLNLYLRTNRTSMNSIKTNDILHKIQSAFLSVIQSNHIEVPYSRCFSEQELKNYGFFRRPASEWDMSKVILPSGDIKKEYRIQLESFDEVAILHILSERCPFFEKFINNEFGFPVRVYCGWDEERQVSNHYIFFSNESEQELFSSQYSLAAITNKLRSLITPYDKWSLITEDFYHPRFEAWDKLTKEKKIHFLRGF